MRTIRKDNRGSGLILAFFFLILLSMMAVAYMNLIPSELTSAKKAQFDIQAGYAADAGVVAAIAYLEEKLIGGTEPLTSPSYTSPEILMSGGPWTYQFTILPDAETPPAGPSTNRIYKITSKADLNGHTRRTVDAWVAQDTWGKYAFFMEKGFGGWMGILDKVTGPMHSNEKLKISVPSGLNYDTAFRDVLGNPEPTFMGETTFSDAHGSSDGVQYGPSNDNDAPYKWAAKPGATRNAYSEMLAGGRDDLHREDLKKMPTNQNELGKAAWYGNTYSGNVPTGSPAEKVTMNAADSGVFISGNVDEMILSVVADNSIVQVRQGGAPALQAEQIITVNSTYIIPTGAKIKGQTLPTVAPVVVPTDSTVVRRWVGGTYEFEVVAGRGNGVVYVDGNIDSLRGVNKGKRTIGTAVDLTTSPQKKGRIEITGDITRADTVVGQEPVGSADGLGLVGYDIVISDTVPRLGTTDPLDIYALLFAGMSTSTTSQGGLVVENWTSGPWGKFIVHGSFIQAEDKAWGYINGSGLPTTGWSSYDFLFDQDLARNPPPFFPTLNKFLIRSYQEHITTS